MACISLEHVVDIAAALFQYLTMLKKEGPKEWIFEECAVSEHYIRIHSNLVHSNLCAYA